MDCSFARGGCTSVEDGTVETRMENLDSTTTRSGFDQDETERQFYQFFQKPTDANNYNTAQARPTQAKPAKPAQAAPVQTNQNPLSTAGYFSNYYAANPYQYQPFQQNPYYFYQPYVYNYWPFTAQSAWGWGKK